MEFSEEEIRRSYSNRLKKYNFKLYKESKEEWINKKTKICLLLLRSNMKFLDICKEVVKTMDLRVSDKSILYLDQTQKDISQNALKRISLYYNIPLNKIKERYTDNYDDVEERMMFRMELYKDGWSIEQIEKYIYKYLLKQECPNLNLEYYECIYHNIMIYQEIYKQEKQKRLGRPSLPHSLKEYIKNKHQTKIRKVMKEKYDFFNKFENVKDNLLSKEEFKEIKSKLDNKKILTKLYNLQI
jgi:hypothetical protein